MSKFNQLCVWQGTVMQGTVMGDSRVEEFEKFFKDKFGVRVKFAEETLTNGSQERGEVGGRNDILFYIHDEDIPQFALKRLGFGIRWWEDVVHYNEGAYLYKQEIIDKYAVKW